MSEGRSWYEEQSAGLGDKFVNVARDAVKGLQTDSEIRPEYYRGFRRVLLLPFPDKVFYRLAGSGVIVFRVLHASREHRRLL